MFLNPLDLTTALRPSLLPDETLLFVQDAVGLYEGKLKIPKYQNGQAYLTSHRVCYVDQTEPRSCSVAINLKEVERPEFYAGFLKSSPKITLYPKASKQLSIATNPSPTAQGTLASATDGHVAPATISPVNATWVCPICSFSNPVPSNFDPTAANARTPLPPCLACGIKPPLAHVIKAAIAAIRQAQSSDGTPQYTAGAPASSTPGTVPCPRCTFQNHPSLSACEICGAPLPAAADKRLEAAKAITRAESPGPFSQTSPLGHEITESIKLSFRCGGEKIFYERLKNALVQRKWLLQSAPPIPKPLPASDHVNMSAGLSAATIQASGASGLSKAIGIAGLERRHLEQTKNNEAVIGTAFSDLEALMTSAKEVIALAEQFANQANIGNNGNHNREAANAASALSLITTKDMLGTGSGASDLYISELSRNLAEYLTDDTRGILRNEGGIMTLVDLWAVFNRARGGVELVSPSDFEKAARRWDELRLPVRLRRFRSGLLVVQGRDRTDEKTVASVLAWLRELHSENQGQGQDREVSWDQRTWGRGVTVQEVAERFGWSVGVAQEELEMCEEKGAVCREVGLQGLRWWENWIVKDPVVHSG
ncbi:Vps36-domain-containing protein [Westerdykella ornata]|uniref:Vacuolar protein-sorting-associated protein 36 n=1 Tax=Westerdykella ornata TaxID=318751 RepID=A0A6A6JHC4_WESOR|nr:Vps36-domain-containing protein [Westerdykella ornata]KAF2275615.1 Vps36-domain-containing protein [Westerdykella ornata]